jgi:hypothetical protein
MLKLCLHQVEGCAAQPCLQVGWCLKSEDGTLAGVRFYTKTSPINLTQTKPNAVCLVQRTKEYGD